MARKKPKRRKIARGFWHMVGRAIDAFFGAADKVAERQSIESIKKRKPKSVRTASTEWTGKPGTPGNERIKAPVVRQGVRWTEHTTVHEVWEVFLTDGVRVEVIVWEGTSEAEIAKTAKARAVELYGVYAEEWTVDRMTLLRRIGEQEAKETEEASA